MDNEFIYSVYSLTDGELGVDESHEDYDSALDAFEAAIKHEESLRDKMNGSYTETTVHLYDSLSGNMLAETCITP